MNENLAKEAAVMRDASSVYKKCLGGFASHDMVERAEPEAPPL